MSELVTTICAFVLLCLAIARYPGYDPSGRCPPGWALDGVRPSGHSRCTPAPPQDCGEPRPPNDRPCPRDDRELLILHRCTGGSRAIVVDHRTVGCQR